MKGEYARYWLKARREIYGCTDYDYALLDYLEREVTSSDMILDICCGAGFPFGEHLIDRSIYLGIDLSPLLIEDAKNAYGDKYFSVGNAEDLDFEDNTFDVTICFHSMWLIPNYMKAIAEMIRVTKPNGAIIFDLMNDKFPNNIKELRQIEFESSGLGKAFRIAKNIVKLISRTGTPKWSNVVHQRPNNITEVLTKIQHLDVVEVTTYSDRLERLNFEKAQTDITEFSKILIHLKKG